MGENPLKRESVQRGGRNTRSFVLVFLEKYMNSRCRTDGRPIICKTTSVTGRCEHPGSSLIVFPFSRPCFFPLSSFPRLLDRRARLARGHQSSAHKVASPPLG